jgi:hypothetical protein
MTDGRLVRMNGREERGRMQGWMGTDGQRVHEEWWEEGREEGRGRVEGGPEPAAHTGEARVL